MVEEKKEEEGKEENEAGVTKEDVAGIMEKITSLTDEVKENRESAHRYDEQFNEDEQNEQNLKNEEANKSEREKSVGDMTLGQLVDVVNSEVAKNVSEPILDIITKMQIADEIKEAESKNEDFGEIKNQVLDVAGKKGLTIEDAVKLVRANNPKSDKEDDPNSGKGKENTPVKKNVGGEKGGVSHQAVDENKVLSIDEAVAKAIESEMGEG